MFVKSYNYPETLQVQPKKRFVVSDFFTFEAWEITSISDITCHNNSDSNGNHGVWKWKPIVIKTKPINDKSKQIFNDFILNKPPISFQFTINVIGETGKVRWSYLINASHISDISLGDFDYTSDELVECSFTVHVLNVHLV